MMTVSETYSVWHGLSSDRSTTACYVTAINVQELGKGTKEFIGDLLTGLGASDVTVRDWRLGEPFAVDFLSSGATDDWRDTWLLTWELTLTAEPAPEFPAEPVDLTIWDSSWDGEEALPTGFEVVASGSGNTPDLTEFDDLSTARCDLGHLHVRVPVTRGGPTAAAEIAEQVKAACAEQGWTTRWLEAPA